MTKNTRKNKGKAHEKPSHDDSNNDVNQRLTREERFAAAETRPQFKVPKANASKVVLDDRFSSVLTDSRFELQVKDKYGRKNKKKKSRGAAKKELESFYVVDNPEESNSSTSVENSDTENNDVNSDSESSAEISDKDKEVDHVSRIAYLTAFSRGEVGGSSSSEDDDSSESSDDDDSDDDSDAGPVGVLDPSMKEDEDVEISYDLSPYLVVTNMDWENVRAADLFCILSSFAPPGAIKKVQVFQSDFGMERMAKDKLHGPQGIWKRTKTMESKNTSSVAEDSDNESLEYEENDKDELNFVENQISNESDFDPEKLRAYETSKLKYYFAVVEVSQPEHADIIYREVDGMEFEHSSTAIDLRTLPKDDLEGVITNRPMRDEATSIPGKYEPPDFVVGALQQTNVQCTWDQGDKEREKKLTNYGSSNWQETFEADDLKAYLASDGSSDEDSDEEIEKKSRKKNSMRKALGLDSDCDSDVDSSDDENSSDATDEDRDMSKQIKFFPDKKNLEERIRSKLDPKEKPNELTPWERYQEKRKQKRKERRQAARGNASSNTHEKEHRDDFFADDNNTNVEINSKETRSNPDSNELNAKAQLELLVAGEQAEEDARDYDIRGIQRLEKNKGKKLKGLRKRKEAKIAADVAGTDFKINVNDDRFKAVLDGSDGRFGIDKTDPNFKDTTSMREILSEQSKRRKNKRLKKSHNVENAIGHDSNKRKISGKDEKSNGASALSFLVKKLKSQVKD